MAVSRSVTTRLVEGLARNFRLDADLFDYFGGSVGGGTIANPDVPARIYKGPLLGDNPSPLMPPQMHVTPGTDPYEPGVAGASNVERTIFVTIFDPYLLQFPEEGSGKLWGPDYIEHCAKLIMAGGDGVTPNNLGRITDPDNGSVMLNLAVKRLQPEPFIASVKDVAIVHRLIATFETRLNQAFSRV